MVRRPDPGRWIHPRCIRRNRVRAAPNRPTTRLRQKGLAVARPEGATGEPPTPEGRKNIAFPLSLDPGAWHSFMLETVGDTMRATTSLVPPGSKGTITRRGLSG